MIGPGLVVGVLVAWVAIGLVLSVALGRRGYDRFAWFVVGAMLGPFGALLAIDTVRHDRRTRSTRASRKGAARPAATNR